MSTWAQARARCDQGAVWPFHCSLAGTVRVYHNGQAGGGEGKGGRAFMALRVGAGSSEVSASRLCLLCKCICTARVMLTCS